MKCNGQCKMNEMVAEHHNESASDVLSHLQKEFFLYYETPMGYKKLNPLLVYSKKNLSPVSTFTLSFFKF
ncbi:MAG: hypothetical protein UZ11_BCD004000897 [Bacteroidetes bacterium OLB11]|nr:MAG: hypothetical protein UZ11_BCD004000897 [Bacteroidetes bacterium OLB11]